MSSVVVVDYGTGNLHSVRRALERVAGADNVVVTQSADVVRSASRVVFPGQGAILDCMRHLKDSGLGEAVDEALRTKPVFAICIGMQMLFEQSEEGDCPCLGIYPGFVRRLPDIDSKTGLSQKVPQMGWNTVRQAQRHPIWEGVSDNAWFYFVHSYAVFPEDQNLMLGETTYGVSFASAVGRDNVFSTQFHPEKSADNGLRLLSNFLQWDPMRSSPCS